jgi:hypothetical protein
MHQWDDPMVPGGLRDRTVVDAREEVSNAYEVRIAVFGRARDYEVADVDGPTLGLRAVGEDLSEQTQCADASAGRGGRRSTRCVKSSSLPPRVLPLGAAFAHTHGARLRRRSRDT